MDQSERPTSMNADDAMQAWRSAVADGRRAYRAWCCAPADDKRSTYALYRAAADREDAAQSARARFGRVRVEPAHLGRLVWPGVNRLTGTSWL